MSYYTVIAVDYYLSMPGYFVQRVEKCLMNNSDKIFYFETYFGPEVYYEIDQEAGEVRFWRFSDVAQRYLHVETLPLVNDDPNTPDIDEGQAFIDYLEERKIYWCEENGPGLHAEY